MLSRSRISLRRLIGLALFWLSNGRLPRTAQHRNVLIALHRISRHPSPSILEARHYAFTHAYFPKWAFDEVLEIPAGNGGGWIIGRAGEGYVALFSHLPYEWQTKGPDAGQEVIALGRKNVWIVQLGRQAVDGSFEDFVVAITSAQLRVRGLRVEFQSPGNGQVTFGWNGPLRVDGKEVALRGYDRWSNPYTQAEFGATIYSIEHGGKKLELDFGSATRR